MFEKMKFRVITNHTEEAAVSIKDLLKKEGFEIYDLRESDIIKSSDGFKIQPIYVLCCKGTGERFDYFKVKHKFEEMNYEGFRTLL